MLLKEAFRRIYIGLQSRQESDASRKVNNQTRMMIETVNQLESDKQNWITKEEARTKNNGYKTVDR